MLRQVYRRHGLEKRVRAVEEGPLSSARRMQGVARFVLIATFPPNFATTDRLPEALSLLNDRKCTRFVAMQPHFAAFLLRSVAPRPRNVAMIESDEAFLMHDRIKNLHCIEECRLLVAISMGNVAMSEGKEASHGLREDGDPQVATFSANIATRFKAALTARPGSVAIP
jgi:hypothetical protein